MTKENENSKRAIFWKIILILISAFIGSYLGSYFQARSKMDLQKYEFMTQFHFQTVELFNRLEFVADTLIRKHGFDRVNQSDMPEQDLEQLNTVISDLNNQLQKMYLIMPDDSYGRVVKAVPNDLGKLKRFKYKLLPELRRAQFNKTKYIDPNDIKLIKFK